MEAINIIMDQALFEQAIAPFAKKVVDKHNEQIVSYDVTLRTNRRLHATDPVALEEYRAKQEAIRKRLTAPRAAATDYNKLRADYKPRKKLRIHTPDGWFDNPIDAAEHFGLSMPQLYARVQQSKKTKKGNKDWYYED